MEPLHDYTQPLSGSLSSRIMVLMDYGEEHGLDPIGASDTLESLSGHLQRSWQAHPAWTATDWWEDFWYWRNKK